MDENEFPPALEAATSSIVKNMTAEAARRAVERRQCRPREFIRQALGAHRNSRQENALGNNFRKHNLWGLLFVSPWIIGFSVFVVGPMIVSLYLSFCKYELETKSYIGLANYKQLMFQDPLFWKSLWNTVCYALFAVPLGLTGSLLLAVLLNQNIRMKGLLRTMFYIPTLVPIAAASYLWVFVFQGKYGLLNAALKHILGPLGMQPPDWLHDSRTAMPALILMGLWGIGGGRMIIFLAGLQDISPSLYESASIDGASKLRQFWHITIPMLTPVIFFNAVLGVIGAFQVFTQAFLMTNGGPDNATLFYALYMFQNAFQLMHMGYASALAWILFLILAAVTAVQFAGSRRWVHYEGELT